MTVTFHQITEQEKQLICSWRYPEPYNIYNLPDAESSKTSGTGFYNPEKDKNYYTYYKDNTLIGYTSFTEKDSYVMIGIGLHPDFCGKGYGEHVLNTACKLCENLFPQKSPALQVRSWNIRAIKCYEKAGFVISGSPFSLITPLGEGEFIRMLRIGHTANNT